MAKLPRRRQVSEIRCRGPDGGEPVRKRRTADRLIERRVAADRLNDEDDGLPYESITKEPCASHDERTKWEVVRCALTKSYYLLLLLLLLLYYHYYTTSSIHHHRRHHHQSDTGVVVGSCAPPLPPPPPPLHLCLKNSRPTQTSAAWRAPRIRERRRERKRDYLLSTLCTRTDDATEISPEDTRPPRATTPRAAPPDDRAATIHEGTSLDRANRRDIPQRLARRCQRDAMLQTTEALPDRHARPSKRRALLSLSGLLRVFNSFQSPIRRDFVARYDGK